MNIVLSNKKLIEKLWNEDSEFLEMLSTEELFQAVMFFIRDNSLKYLIDRDFNKILDRCTVDFDMFNFLTILALKVFGNEEQKNICNNSLKITVKTIFSNETIIYLMKKFRKIKDTGIIPRDLLFEEILNDLKEFDTSKSSKILFDLYIFPDFRLMLETKHRVIATLIDSYQIYNPDIVSSQMFKGSTIIGKLLKNGNEKIVLNYLRSMLKEKQVATRNVKMIGGGGTCLVYKIGDSVIKLGETRINRKIYINHRILASQLRKLELDDEGNELFYVEIMKYALVGDVTPEERDELKHDLYEQGLIWEDDKLENCGVLVDGDENICELPVDYIEVAGRIDNPYDREQFMKRKRKVVVIDNDYIRLNPLKLRK